MSRVLSVSPAMFYPASVLGEDYEHGRREAARGAKGNGMWTNANSNTDASLLCNQG